jgi:plastocyanin
MRFPFSSRALSAVAAGGLAAAALTACGGATHAATAGPTATHAEAAAAHTLEKHATAAAPAGDAAPAAPVATSTITIENFAFTPAAITVNAGTTVTWTNNDDEPHSVVSSDEPMRSPTLAGKANAFSHTFTKPGRYAYNCGIHPFMHGTLEVTA